MITLTGVLKSNILSAINCPVTSTNTLNNTDIVDYTFKAGVNVVPQADKSFVLASDDKVMLPPPIVFSLEEALEYIQEDELVEVTPKSMRLRKIILSEIERKRKSSDFDC